MKKEKIKDWYKQIEPEVRETVKLLRNNGFNTTCSCGHEMSIELTLGNHLGEVEALATFLVDNKYKGFKIDVQLYVPKDGYWDRRATIIFNTLSKNNEQRKGKKKKI